MNGVSKVLSLSLVATIAGCAGVVAQPPIAPGQSVQLQPGEGIAALLMDTQDPVTQVRLQSPDDRNPTLDLPSMSAGRQLALFAVPAGVYCLKQFNYGRYQFHSQKLELGCFQVAPGRISYSGTIVPSASVDPAVAHDEALISQEFEPQVFLDLLKRQYPQLMAAYPTAGPAPASEDGAQDDVSREMAAWSVEAEDHHSFDVYVRNNTNWDLTLDYFEISTCINIKQPCGKQAVNVPVAPNTTVKFTTLEQADPQQAYRFEYYYNYDRMDMGSKP